LTVTLALGQVRPDDVSAAGLAAGGVRHADDREAGQPRRHVDLDAHGTTFDAEQRRGTDGGEHGRDLLTGGS
jgi:hypothetical protein